MRQIPEPMSTPPFSRRETAGRGVAASRCALHILNLQHTSGFDSVAGRVHSYHRPDNGQNSQSVSIQNAGRGEIAPAGVGVPACAVFGSRRGPFWALTPPRAPRPARCGRARRPRRWPCPCRSTCSRPGDRQRLRRPPAPPAPRTACRGPRSWRR